MPSSLDPNLFLAPANTLRDALVRLDTVGRGIVMIIEENHKLVGTVTDGDIRRALLESMAWETPISDLLRRKSADYIKPITALVGTSHESLLHLMKKHVVRQIPLLDETGQVQDLITLDDLLPEVGPGMQAVVMAGGFGSRLSPLTDAIPKPMLPVGGRPLLERIIEQLKNVGIQNVTIATHYRPEVIKEHFGNGKAFGLEINYLNEDCPMGTAGCLGLIKNPKKPLLIINGDILTQVDFAAMLMYHRENRAAMTVAVRSYELKVPYGVVDCDGHQVFGIREKPSLSFFVNAGIYLIEPGTCQHIPSGEFFNMTDLIQALLKANHTVVSFPVHEYWLDIGQHHDYERAQLDVKEGKMNL